MIGQVLGGRYKITELIGSGGMAQVFRAQDTVLGRIVAVKLMLPQFATDEEFKSRFRQEASAIANLQSPFIVNVYDWGEEGQNYYIVMEFVRGSDLKTGIKQRGALNQRKVAEIGMQVCQALSVAHNQDIVHRDTKPQNIMVQPDGNVKVMDFGIAHAKNTLKNKTTNVLGTAHYISPEQAQGKDVGPQSDIYSLGCCLYEAATGKLPFDGDDAVSVAMKQVNEIPTLPSTINKNIDPNLERIIMHAMEKDPKKRYATVNEMRDDLIAFLNGSSPRAGEDVSATQVIPVADAGAAMGATAVGDPNSKNVKNFNVANNNKKKSKK
ncbi:MAG: serine/threonine protein kinase, partial [Eggerthellaceae bacterium]|nr:serine/threonine protein kinase [Eggerthellaceae bacterium]